MEGLRNALRNPLLKVLRNPLRKALRNQLWESPVKRDLFWVLFWVLCWVLYRRRPRHSSPQALQEHFLERFNQRFNQRFSQRFSFTSRTSSAVVRLRGDARETLARNTAKTRATSRDVKMVSGETMTETMTLGRKNTKRDTTYRRIALRVAPPGLEPGLS